MANPFIVPAYGTVGNDLVLNQLFDPGNVAYPQFGDAALLSNLNTLWSVGTQDLVPPPPAGPLLPASATPYFDLNNGAVAQTFTTSGATTFQGVETFPIVIGDARATLIVQLQTTSGGQPSGTVLQEVHVPASVVQAKGNAVINPTIGISDFATVFNATSPAFYGGGTVCGTAGLAGFTFSGSPTLMTTAPLNSVTGLSGQTPNVTYPIATGFQTQSSTLAYYNGTLYATGGLISQSPFTCTSSIYTATVDGSGNIGTLNLSNTSLPVALTNHGAVVVTGTDGNPYLLIVGGYVVSGGALTPNATVYWSAIGSSGLGPFSSQSLSNSLFSTSSTDVFTIASNFNGQVVVGALDRNSNIYPLYLLNNNLPTSIGLQALTIRNGYGVTSGLNLSCPWQSTSGDIFAVDGMYGGYADYFPSIVMKANPQGSMSWASNPYPILGSHGASGTLLTQPPGCVNNLGSGNFIFATGTPKWPFLNGYQLEAFRIPFYKALSASTTYAVVFSLQQTTGDYGPGASIGLPLSFSNNASATNCALLYMGGTLWDQVAFTQTFPGGTTLYAQVPGYFFDNAASPISNRYSGYVDVSATVVPRWQVAYWNNWSNQVECVVSVAGNDGEILLPEDLNGQVQTS